MALSRRRHRRDGDAFALTALLGHENVSVYDASLQDGGPTRACR
jgi:hypothetical protein